MTGAEPVGPVITYRKALQDTLRAELVRDQNVFLMGEEIGVFEGPTRSPRVCSRTSSDARTGHAHL